VKKEDDGVADVLMADMINEEDEGPEVESDLG
jgi:hypothetical protein